MKKQIKQLNEITSRVVMSTSVNCSPLFLLINCATPITLFSLLNIGTDKIRSQFSFNFLS